MQKRGVLFKKTQKNMTFHITWGSIQEWGCIEADIRYIREEDFFQKLSCREIHLIGAPLVVVHAKVHRDKAPCCEHLYYPLDIIIMAMALADSHSSSVS